MINKFCVTPAEALGPVADGSKILIGGFGEAGIPSELVDALIDSGARDLSLVLNNAGNGEIGVAKLLSTGRVRKITCSFPKGSASHIFRDLYESEKIELELYPQGTLAEAIRAGGAGLGGFFTRTGVGTILTEGKETRRINGCDYVLEAPIRGHIALIKAQSADRWGNLTYRAAARNFNPVMAMAADRTVAQVTERLELGDLDPETIVTPGVFVQSVVHVPTPVSEARLLMEARP